MEAERRAEYTQLQDARLATLTSPASTEWLHLAQAALEAGCTSDAVLFLGSLRGNADAQRMLDALMVDAQLKDLLRVLWGSYTQTYVLMLDDPEIPSSRTRCLAEALLSLGKTVCLVQGSSARQVLQLPSGSVRILVPEPQEPGSLAALLSSVKQETGPERDMAIGYSSARMEELTGSLQDLLVLYSNPASALDYKYACYMGGTKTASAAILPSENRARTLFSIVIPTRNSARYLESCLKTLLEQNFDDYEIVIGDNSSVGNDETFDLVKRLDSKKIHYVRAARQLCLPDSFEFAHAQCRGEYVLGLGSDDGLLFHGLKTLAAVIDKVGMGLDALKFDFLYYGWPSAMPAKFKHFFRVPPTIVKHDGGPPMEWVDSKEMLYRYQNFKTLFHNIPNGYGYSILSRRLLGTLKRSLGRIFPANSQDTYTSTYVLALTASFLRLDFPITAFAVSGNSVGSQFEYGGTEQARTRHMLELTPTEMGIEEFVACDPAIKKGLQEDVCGFFSQEFLNAENIADAVKRKLLPPETLQNLDWERYFRRCLACIYEGDTLFQEKLQDIWTKIQRRKRPDLEDWFVKDYLNNPDFKGAPVPVSTPFRYGLLPNQVLYLNASDFGVTNVYEATQLFQKISHL